MSARHFDAIVVQKTIAAAGATYTANDQVGTLLTFSNILKDTKGVVRLESLVVLDKAKQKILGDFLFFNESPTFVSADQDEFELSAAHSEKIIAVVPVAAADYKDTKGQAVAQALIGAYKPVLLQGIAQAKDLYAVFVTRGTPTYTANCLVAKFGFVRP